MPQASAFVLSIGSSIRRGVRTTLSSPCAHVPVCRSSGSGVVNILRLGGLLGRSGGAPVRRVSLQGVVGRPLFIPRAVLASRLVSCLGGDRGRLTLLRSRCNNVIKVIALRSVLRRVINSVRSRCSRDCILVRQVKSGMCRTSKTAPLRHFGSCFNARLRSTSISAVTNCLLARLNRFPRRGRRTSVRRGKLVVGALTFSGHQLLGINISCVGRGSQPTGRHFGRSRTTRATSKTRRARRES